MASEYFSPDYCTARDRFCNAARAIGAVLDELELDVRGPRDERLTINIAWFGAERPRKLLLHTSGLHGVEGFVGSAIQLQLLERLPDLPHDAAFLFVHGINPYGMAFLRRVNENNVDLNRNFLGQEETYDGVSDAYRKLNALLNPQSPPRAVEFFGLKVFWYILRFGFNNLKQGIAQGQYEFPKGLFFGGEKLEQSACLVLDWFNNRLGGVETIFAIDVHTGLGKYAEDMLLVSCDRDSDQFRNIQKILGNRTTALAPDTDAYRIQGGFLDALERDISGPEWTCVCQEFGTFGPLKVLKALRQENRWHHDTDKRQIDHPAKQVLLRAFCPDDISWREKILTRGREVVETISLKFLGL